MGPRLYLAQPSSHGHSEDKRRNYKAGTSVSIRSDGSRRSRCSLDPAGGSGTLPRAGTIHWRPPIGASTYRYVLSEHASSLSSDLPDSPVAIVHADGLWFPSGQDRRLLWFIARAIDRGRAKPLLRNPSPRTCAYRYYLECACTARRHCRRAFLRPRSLRRRIVRPAKFCLVKILVRRDDG